MVSSRIIKTKENLIRKKIERGKIKKIEIRKRKNWEIAGDQKKTGIITIKKIEIIKIERY